MNTNSKIDIMTQIGMIDPILEKITELIGLFPEAAEIVGSYPRNTSLDSKNCIDILLPLQNQNDVKKVRMYFDSLNGAVINKGFMVEFAIGSGWVGIIPALTSNRPNYYHLLDYSTGKTIFTNPLGHVNYIKNSGFEETIKNTKLWFLENELNVSSFLIENIVLEALKGKSSRDIIQVFEYLCCQFSNAELFDFMNINNNLTKGIAPELKNRIIRAAQKSFDKSA